MSQKELAAHIGVTPSNISQIESNLIYPSLPALFKIAESLSVEAGSFFQDGAPPVRTVFPKGSGVKITMPDMPKDCLEAMQITPPDLGGKAELYLVRILPGKKLPAHFFVHKGEEAGYVLEGSLTIVSRNGIQELTAGDAIYLKTDFPTQWINPGSETAKLLWMKVR
jgi:transcriptional regulator with XRE-family HTH domain